jgi:hypothetical protein
MTADPSHSRPPNLTPRQVQEEIGLALLTALHPISAERRLTEADVRRLRDWRIAFRDSELLASGFTRPALDRLITAGVASDGDLVDIYLALARMVPVMARGFGAEPEAPWREERLSSAQMDFVGRLRGSISALATKGEAAHLIERLLRDQPLTERQSRLAQFWGKALLRGEGALDFSDWMETFQAEDPDRRRAWELYLAEEGAADAAAKGGLDQVYLARIKRGGAAAIARAPAPVAPSIRRAPLSARAVYLTAGLVVALLGGTAVVWLRQTAPVKSPALAASPAAAKPADPVAAAVQALPLTGIVSLQEPAALIGGKLYRVGDLADAAHGIRIVRIDVDANVVDFIDASGRVLTRRL